MIITVISVFVLASLSLPICFKTGAQWIRVVNVVIFLLIFFAPVQIAEYMVNNPQTPWIRILIDMAGSQTWQLMLMGSVILLIILFISYYISLRIYINKDFLGLSYRGGAPPDILPHRSSFQANRMGIQLSIPRYHADTEVDRFAEADAW